MSKRQREVESTEARVCMRGMTMHNGTLLIGALRALYGDAFDDLTVQEVMERHADLVAKLDGERQLDGCSISDESMSALTLKNEISEAVHGARGRVVEIDENVELKLPKGL